MNDFHPTVFMTEPPVDRNKQKRKFLRSNANFAGFILLLFAPGALKWTIALPVILVNFFLQSPPVLVQRYNRHRLQKLYALQLRKKSRAEAAATTAE